MRKLTACASAALLLVTRPAAAEPTASEPPPAPAAPANDGDGGLLKHLKIQAYVQAQFLTQHVNEAASPNLRDGHLPEGASPNDVVAKADGTTTNSTLFRLRRTRLRLKYEVEHARVFLQLDPFPAGGPSAAEGTIARNAEVTGIIRWSDDVRTEIGAGLFVVPFRFELLESSTTRPFLERTSTIQNVFPGERDIGVRATTIALGEKLVVETGVLNGYRLGQPHFVELPDPDRSKDVFARAEYKLGPVRLGVFGYVGRGSLVDAEDLRFATYPRRAVNFGVQYADTLFSALGETRASGELLFGRNMDSGARYKFGVPPVFAAAGGATGLDERGLYLRAEQDLGTVPFFGFRYDMYTPDSSVANNARDTYTVMAGANVSKHLRVVTEGTYVIDDAHARDALPPSKHLMQYSLWMQGGFY